MRFSVAVRQGVSEGFQKLDQRTLVVIAHGGLAFDVARAEVVAAVDHEIRAFAELEQARSEIALGECGAQLLIGRSLRQAFQCLLEVDEQCGDLRGMRQLFGRAAAFFAEQVEIGDEIHRVPFGSRPSSR